MEAQHRAVGKATRKEPVLHLLNRKPHEAKGVHMLGRSMARHVENAGKAPPRIEDRRRGTGQHPMRLKEVLGPMHGDRSALEQGGADGIGAGGGFAPGNAWTQRHLRCLPGKFNAADGIEHDAMRIGDDDDAVGQLGFRPQHADFGPTELPQQVVAFLQLAQFGACERLDLYRIPGVQTLLRAAQPGAQDRRRHQTIGKLITGEKTLPRLGNSSCTVR